MPIATEASPLAVVSSPSAVDVTIQGRKLHHGVKIWPVNVSTAKSELYGRLNRERPKEGEPYPAGWVHFATGLDEEFFRQITAEQFQSKVVKGHTKYEWVKLRERNEALDCANYARAAANVCGMDRFMESHWAALEAGLENGTLRPVVGKELPLAEAAAGHLAVMEPGAYGKIVLIP